MKSAAPSLVAATALWMFAWPEIIMTGTAGCSAFIRRSSSMPSTSGIHTSSSTIAGVSRWIRSITPGASPVSTTRKPSSLRMPRNDDRIRSSSSTTNTVSFTIFPLSWVLPLVSIRFSPRLLRVSYWKLHDESTSARLVIGHPHKAVMVGDDRRDDREAQPGAARLIGKVRLENSRAQPGIDSGTVVADFQRHQPDVGAQRRSHIDPRLGAITIVGGGRADGVVEQVYERPLHSLAVDHQFRQAARQVQAKLHPRIRGFKTPDGVRRERIQVAGRGRQVRHSRKSGKFIDQPFQRFDLADDCAGAFVPRRVG